MTDSGQVLEVAADPGPGPLCSIADLTGFDLQAIHKAIGKPLIAALDDNDEVGMYAFVWRAEQRRDGTDLTFDDVMERPFSAILDAFTGANDGAGITTPDPTIAGSGNDSHRSATSGD